MEAIILAGGLGTRLRRAVPDLPKPMAPVAGRPFLEYLLDYLNKERVKRVILAVGYKWEVIANHFGTNYCGMELEYSIEKEPLGTGGGLRQALELVEEKSPLVLNGDTFFPVPLEEFPIEKGEVTIALKQLNNPQRYGIVELNEEKRVVRFSSKKGSPPYSINGGVYRIDKDIFKEFSLPLKFSFEEFLSKNVDRLHIYGKTFDTFFIDIGVPEDYTHAQTLIPSIIEEGKK